MSSTHEQIGKLITDYNDIRNSVGTRRNTLRAHGEELIQLGQMLREQPTDVKTDPLGFVTLVKGDVVRLAEYKNLDAEEIKTCLADFMDALEEKDRIEKCMRESGLSDYITPSPSRRSDARC